MSDLLKPSCDRKVRMYKTQHNSFGCMPGPLSEGGTCAGCTSGDGGCWETSTPNGKVKVCYVDKLRRAYKGVDAVLKHNTRLLTDGPDGAVALLHSMFSEFEDTCDRYEKRTGDKDARRFRLYWSGDVDSTNTAEALRRAIRAHPRVNFWTYTRSFSNVSYLMNIPNLRLFVSLDKANKEEGMDMFSGYNEHGDLSLCYMGKEQPKGFIPCPVDDGKMVLDGACRKCMLCVRTNHDKNIWFNIK